MSLKAGSVLSYQGSVAWRLGEVVGVVAEQGVPEFGHGLTPPDRSPQEPGDQTTPCRAEATPRQV